MLIMAVSGAAVLALICWAALRERAPRHFIPQTASECQIDQGEGERQRAGGRGSDDPADDDMDTTPSRPLAGTIADEPDALHNTYADADTDQAIAAAAALWNVMTQERQE